MKAFRPTESLHPLQEKFALTRQELAAALIERDEEIDLILTALLRRNSPCWWDRLAAANRCGSTA